MKKLILLVMALSFLFGGCTTIAHKNIETHWQGYGVTVDYTSTVGIPSDQIPAFIRAVDRLEKLWLKMGAEKWKQNSSQN